MVVQSYPPPLVHISGYFLVWNLHIAYLNIVRRSDSIPCWLWMVTRATLWCHNDKMLTFWVLLFLTQSQRGRRKRANENANIVISGIELSISPFCSNIQLCSIRGWEGSSGDILLDDLIPQNVYILTSCSHIVSMKWELKLLTTCFSTCGIISS